MAESEMNGPKDNTLSALREDIISRPLERRGFSSAGDGQVSSMRLRESFQRRISTNSCGRCTALSVPQLLLSILKELVAISSK